jgi:NADH-quinone oxidoreductase subunit M
MAGPNGLIAHPVSSSAQIWLFLAFGMAFAIKIPIWPFHLGAHGVHRIADSSGGRGGGRAVEGRRLWFPALCLPLFPSASRQLAALLSCSV